MDQGLEIVPVNGYGIKIYEKAHAESTGRGRGSLMGMAWQIVGLFRQDVKWLDVIVVGKRYRARG
jgi:hypothetical protein